MDNALTAPCVATTSKSPLSVQFRYTFVVIESPAHVCCQKDTVCECRDGFFGTNGNCQPCKTCLDTEAEVNACNEDNKVSASFVCVWCVLIRIVRTANVWLFPLPKSMLNPSRPPPLATRSVTNGETFLTGKAR